MNQPSEQQLTTAPMRLKRILLGTILPPLFGTVWLTLRVLITEDGVSLDGWDVVLMIAFAITTLPALVLSLLAEFFINRPGFSNAVVYGSATLFGVGTGFLFTVELNRKNPEFVIIGAVVGLMVAHVLRRHRLSGRLL